MNWLRIIPGRKDTYPVPEIVVLAYFDDGEIWTLWQNWAEAAEDDPFEYSKDPDWEETHRVTHWMPLPEPPKED